MRDDAGQVIMYSLYMHGERSGTYWLFSLVFANLFEINDIATFME